MAIWLTIYNNDWQLQFLLSFLRLPEPEPLRHNISNYINTAKKMKTSASDIDKENIGDDIKTTTEDSDFIIRESEIGPEVTHIYQIENKVPFRTIL